MITTILLFLAVLFVLVLVHEWGHYIIAKKTGMRVDEFGIGFPPRLFGVKKGETEYTLNALPLGGFVRIYGETLIHGDGEEKDPDHDRAMWARPKWAQALVLVAGVTMNVILAWFLYLAVFMMGVPTPVEEGAPIPSNAQLYVAQVLEGSPLGADLPPGTIITRVEAGETVLESLTPADFSGFIAEQSEKDISITFLAGDTEQVKTVRPVAGLIESDPGRKAIGVSLALVAEKKQGLWEAMGSATSATWAGLTAITSGLWMLLSNAVVGEADLSQVAGPIGIAGMVGDAASFGLTSLFSFVAVISLNLAIINLLPFPALDGGRLLLLAGEAIFRRPANAAWTHRLNAIGFVLLMGIMLIVTYGDIMRLL